MNRVSPSPAGMAFLLERCGISLSRVQLEQLWAYHELLRRHNPELNLTRIHNFSNMVIKLYVDSILPSTLIRLPSPLMDLGTGAGMPGIPLKIAHPDLEIHLAESRQNRVAFLRMALEHLQLKGIEIIGRSIGADFEYPVAGVITRAVESMEDTLHRVSGCVAPGGLVIFMKGPRGREEIEQAVVRFEGRYRMARDITYSIPKSTHERLLVVFERLDAPLYVRKMTAMKRHGLRKLESEHNDLFKDLKKLLGSRGIKKQGQAMVAGHKQVAEALKLFPDRCEAWLSIEDRTPPPVDSPSHLMWYQLAPALYRTLDLFGTNTPILLFRIQDIPVWRHEEGLPEGCTVFIPFQDPENVGAALRSSVAFGATRIILLAESAHPYHPKSLRASGGAVFHAQFLQGPSLGDIPDDLPLVPLSMDGQDISSFTFPHSFGFLPGMEGPGLPDQWRRNGVAIPISREVESLNAATALAIALYQWSQSKRSKHPEA